MTKGLEPLESRTMEQQIKTWALGLVTEAEGRTNWAEAPASLQTDAVRSVFLKVRPHFDSKAVKAKIAANAARTFAELRNAINA